MNRCLIQTTLNGQREWLDFDKPKQYITTNNLEEVQQKLSEVVHATSEGLWAVGFVSYDAGPAFDPAIKSNRNSDVPLLAFGIFDDFEVVTSRAPRNKPEITLTQWKASVEHDVYIQNIHNIKSQIEKGETYQVNYTFLLETDFRLDPLEYFWALNQAQDGGYNCYIDLGHQHICSVSPELFFKKTGHTVTAIPMKGTRPRLPDHNQDIAQQHDLSHNQKDLAENTMIVDMVRNDLSRIAELGTMKVEELYRLRSYPTVHQLTSTVTANTDKSIEEIFQATFPAASITGAPKYRTSEIIKDLEIKPRGVYTGAIGAISPNGDAEFSVAIRTMWIDCQKSIAQYGVGGGIIWDSDPETEWKEAHHKAEVLNLGNEFMVLDAFFYSAKHGPTLISGHLDRLERATTKFSIPFERETALKLIETVNHNEDLKVRLTVGQTGELNLQSVSLGQNQPLKVAIDSEPIDTEDAYLYYKTTQREQYRNASDRFPDFDDVILWNRFGEITETTRTNIVVNKAGKFLTPKVQSGLLGGVLRERLLQIGCIREATILVSELKECDEIYLINSVRGWTKITITQPK